MIPSKSLRLQKYLFIIFNTIYNAQNNISGYKCEKRKVSTPLDMMSVGISDQFIIQRRQSSLIQLWQGRNLYMIYFAAIYLSKLSRTQRSHDQDQSKRNHWRHNNASNLFTAIYFFFITFKKALEEIELWS